MASVRDIAKQAGVSISTVSRVLNNHPHVSESARELVLAAANKSRYVAKIGRRETNNIAFVYTGEPSLGSPFDAALLAGIGDALESYDCDLMILDARRAHLQDETYSNMFMRKGVRGAILRATSKTRAVCEAISEEGFPVVVVGERFEGSRIPFVYNDSRAASREAVDYLIGLGHRRIAVCVNIVDDSDHIDRLAGYRESLESHGISFSEQLVWRVPANRAGGAQVIKRVTANASRPTAVYITDPLTGIGAIATARQAGLRVPDDLSIIGFDDSDLRSCVFPQMSAVCQDAVALGREAMRVLDRVMEDGPKADGIQKRPTCWLELHDTTAAPAQA